MIRKLFGWIAFFLTMASLAYLLHIDAVWTKPTVWWADAILAGWFFFSALSNLSMALGKKEIGLSVASVVMFFGIFFAAFSIGHANSAPTPVDIDIAFWTLIFGWFLLPIADGLWILGSSMSDEKEEE